MYSGQEAAVLEEYTGAIDPHKFKLLCDGKVKVDLPVKFGAVQSRLRAIEINTNVPFDQWYNNWRGIDDESKKAIARRIDCICKYE